MTKLQESVLAVTRNSPLSAGITSFLQDEYSDQPPLGGILSDARLGWLASGPKLCVVDLKTGQKVAARTFGATFSMGTRVTCVRELPTPLADNTRQLLVALSCEDAGGFICVFHCNGSQVLRCIQTQAVVTELTVMERVPDGPLACCDGLVAAGTRHGQLFVFDLNRAKLIQALKNTSQGYGHLVRNEHNMTNLAFLSIDDIGLAEEQREIALESDDHLAVDLSDRSHVDGEYVLRNPDGSVRMKAKLGHVAVSALLYVPQLGSAIVGYNFGAFQIWNLRRMCLEYTSPVNVECLPVTHFGFQEPCDDPRAFCYLWVTYSASDRAEEEACPLAIMYALTYQGKRILSETQCLYQDFINCTSRFVLDLTCAEESGMGPATGGRGVACHTYSVPSCLHGDGDEGVLNICQLVWESWCGNPNSPVRYTMLLFDLDQWYKDQMPERWPLQNSTFMCVVSLDAACDQRACVLRDVRLLTSTLAPYTHVRRLEEHFYPNSLQYSCISLTSEDASLLWTAGVQRQLISGMDEVGPTVLLHPTQLYQQCVAAGLTPLYGDTYLSNPDVMEQRKFLLSVALEGRLSQLLKRCARDWASGSHSGAGCTLQLFVEWCWSRALVLKRNARDLTAPLLEHSGVAPDRNVFRCLEHSVRQLTLLAGLLDAVVTKCCNLVVPDALSDMEERCKAIGMVGTYFRVVQWFLNVGLLPEFSVHQEPHMLHNGDQRLPYPIDALNALYQKRRIKLCCLDGKTTPEYNAAGRSCALLYIDQLIERECGGELIHNLWRWSGESESDGVYPPPSLHALLRVYLLPDVPNEHKHSLVLYLLMDFSATFSDVRYEAVIRRLMQFPTMFGLSNTAIKATQAFWHLDHRNFDFALDQLQCLTGNTLTDWQHSVVLSALLAQKKTQAALQYIHVRKPPPIQSVLNGSQSPNERTMRRMDNDKLEDWQSCCDLYLARELLFEAMDVVRLCVQSMPSAAEKAEVLNFFFRGCKKTGQLSKILQITLLPFEEEMFVKYLQSSGERQCADILVMYYVQQARYLEAQRYNSKLKQSTQQSKDAMYGSADSLADSERNRDMARDTLVELVCTALPRITDKVAASMMGSLDATPKVVNAKPMSVYVQASSPKNEYVYKSSFIQNTIENASETWVRRPQAARGLKRALHIEDTPFICTPKLSRASRSIFSHSGETSEMSIEEDTPPKRARLDASVGTPKLVSSAGRMSARLSRDVLNMLEIPDVERVPDWKIHSADHMERSVREATPQSILKVRRLLDREQPSPVDSHYLGDTDEELETGSRHSNHTHCSDKHLRFAIPSSSNSASTSPDAQLGVDKQEADIPSTTSVVDQHDGPGIGASVSRYSEIGGQTESPVKMVQEGSSTLKKSYKDNVRARLSNSISANSSLNDDQHSSIESIADIPVMIINPRYSGEFSRTTPPDNLYRKEVAPTTKDSVHITIDDTTVGRSLSDDERDDSLMSIRSNFTSTPRTPRSRPSIRSRSVGVDSPASTRILRSRSRTPERVDMLSPGLLAVTSPRPQRTRSRSKTPDLKDISPKGSPKLDPIPELPQLEQISNEISSRKILRTPEKNDSSMVEVLSDTSDVVEVLSDSPQKDLDTEESSPLRSERSRSTTPEVLSPKVIASTSRTLRGRSKTPEREVKLGSPKLLGVERPKQKPLSRLVLEANTFTKINKPKVTKNIDEEVPISSSNNARAESPNNKSVLQDPSDSVIESTPMKDINMATKPMADYEFSPIDKSVLSGSPISILSNTPETSDISFADLTTPKTGTPFSATYLDKSVLGGYRSSSVDNSESNSPTEMNVERPVQKRLEYSASPIDPLANESVLRDASTEVSARTIDNSALTDDLDEPSASYDQENITDDKNIEVVEVEEGPSTKDIQEEKQKIVEIEREINEIEGQIEGISDLESDNSDNNSDVEEDEDSGQVSDESDPAEGEESEDDESDSGKDSDEENDESSNDEANKALCVGNSEVISLEDSSDDERGSPPKIQRLSSSSDNSSSVALQIDVESDIDIENEEESNSIGKSENELEKNIESNVDLDTSFSESLKDGSGMLDKEQDPFLKPPSEKGNQSDTEVVFKPTEAPIIHQEESNSGMDTFNDGNYSLMTDDSSVLNTDRSEIDGTVAETVEVEQKEGETVKVKVTEAIKVVVEIESMDVVDNIPIIEKTANNKPDHQSTTEAEPEKDKNIAELKEPVSTSRISNRRGSALSNQSDYNTMPKTPTSRQSKDKSEAEIPIEEMEEAETVSTPKISKRRASALSNQSGDNDVPKALTRRQSKDKSEAEMPIAEMKEAESMATPKISERRVSAKSNQSDDSNMPKTPTRRQSKDKSEAEELKEAETVSTPRISKRRASALSNQSGDNSMPKTPTRRQSKDKSEAEMPMEEMKEAESMATPRISNCRRASAKSNQSDDNNMPKTPTRRQSKDKSEAEMPTEELKEDESVSTPRISKRIASAKSNQSDIVTMPKTPTRRQSKDKSEAEMSTEELKEDESVSTPRISKRIASAKSNQSDIVTMPKKPTRRHSEDKSEAEMPTEELKEGESVSTPRTSKRLASATSDKVTTPKTTTRRHSQDTSEAEMPSEELKEAESVSTPRTSKRLASAASDEVTIPKTPTGRQSKDKPEAETPLRRSARRVSKQSEEDNTSIISGSSVKSAQSKGSKSDSAKATGRKLRKSILMNTKPDLSVIPEVDDSAIRPEDASQMIQDYSASRRLTRHQRSLLERSMEPPGAGAVRAPRRASVVSSTASVAGSEPSIESASVKSDPFGVQPIDPISLLSKKDFEGPRDLEELYVEEEVGTSAHAVKPSLRKTRAASETGSIKNLRESRRISMDLERVSSPVPSLDASLPGSPSRPRRSSFHKALEALATPKRARRSSTDVREGDTDSLPGSPQPHTSKEVEANVTPSRRTRQNSSVQSDATPVAPSPAKRTRRKSSIAEAVDERETNN